VLSLQPKKSSDFAWWAVLRERFLILTHSDRSSETHRNVAGPKPIFKGGAKRLSTYLLVFNKYEKWDIGEPHHEQAFQRKVLDIRHWDEGVMSFRTTRDNGCYEYLMLHDLKPASICTCCPQAPACAVYKLIRN
jgi:hypothetical protein